VVAYERLQLRRNWRRRVQMIPMTVEMYLLLHLRSSRRAMSTV